MKAEFFRMLFQKAVRGIYYTGAVKDEFRDVNLHLAYVGEGAEIASQDEYPLDILAVGDWKEETLTRIQEMVSKRKITTVIFPARSEAAEDMENFCKEQGVEEVLMAEEAITIHRGRCELIFDSFTGADGATLVMYQGFTDDDLEKEDCALSAKVFKDERCVSCLYGEDDHCGFGCLRAKDFDVLKGHKRKGSENHRLGVLILGSTDVKSQLEHLKAMLEPVAEKLRCIYLPYGVGDENEAYSLAQLADRDYMYFVGHENGVDTARAGAIVTTNPFARYQMVNKEYGFCMSGYRVPFMSTEK